MSKPNKKIKLEKTLSSTRKKLLELANSLGELYEAGMKTYSVCGTSTKSDKEFFLARYEYQKIKKLEAQKLIKLKKRGDELLFKITNDGNIELLKTKIISSKNELPEGQVCVVMFDIPEDIKSVRVSLRKLLKDAGFYMVHKSVWETRYDVVDDMYDFVETLNTPEYIEVYRAWPTRRR